MKVTVLGSGATFTPAGNNFRYSSAHLIEAGDHKILFDASVAVLPQLAKLGLHIWDINAICISHYHADHFALEPLLQALYVYARFSGQRPRIRIFGPSDIEARVRAGYETKAWDFDSELLDAVDVSFTPYESGKATAINLGVELTAFRTKHYDLEAYTLRLETDEGTVGYSGDSSHCPALEAGAKDSDLFLCESAIDIGKQLDPGHVNPYEAGAAAKVAAAKTLVLVHYYGNDSPEAMLQEVKRSGFTGQAEVAQDLSAYLL